MEGKKSAACESFFAGEKMAVVARNYAVHPSTIARWSEEYLQTMPNWSFDAFIEILRVPGNGMQRSLRKMHEKMLKAG